MGSEAYLCVTIDTECDKGKGWRCQKPMSFFGIYEGVANRLQPLFDSLGAKPTYLLSPEVLQDARSVELFQKLEPRAELGTHLHGEYAEPGAFEPDVTSAFQRDYTPEVERQKLTTLTDAFIRAFGSQPCSFRAGRFGIGPETIPILESLGYSVESSVTPHMDWSSSGAPGLTFHGAPTQPYRPNARHPEQTGDSAMIEVPVTIRRRRLNAIPWLGSRVDPLWLRPTRGSVEALLRVAKEEIREARGKAPGRPVFLNAMFHNVEIVPGLSPYADTEDEARGIVARLRGLLEFARRESIRVIGLGDVPEVIRSSGC
jgi:hypothetical protein